MTEDDRRRAARTKTEYHETADAFERVRAVLVAELFKSKLNDSDGRERLYMAVQALDGVRELMFKTFRDADDTKSIDEYVAEITEQK